MKYQLTEPERGNTILQYAIQLSEDHPWISQFAPIGADIFLIIYPIFLIIFYLKGIIKKQTEKKEWALFIFLSCAITLIINIIIQSFFFKNRPNIEIRDASTEETLLHQRLPQSSFPSDHAVVSMSIAIASLVWGYKTKNKLLIWFSYVLILIAIIMSACRVITVVHRPSDILGGFILAIIIPILLGYTPLLTYLKKWIITPIIKCEERIIKKCFNY